MKNIVYISLIIIGCSSTSNDEIESLENNISVPIIAERIDGPANIRDRPNGEILFSLNDNVLVDVSPSKDDWHELIVYAETNELNKDVDSIYKDSPIFLDKKNAGTIIKTQFAYRTNSGKESYIMLHGFTHKDNIKPETILENQLLKGLKESNRKFDYWKEFIHSFKLRNEAFDYEGFDSYYNYENGVEDPSSGFRIVLLFEKEELKGFIHSRALKLEGMITHKLERGYHISYYHDYPQNRQHNFIDYFEDWIQGVD